MTQDHRRSTLHALANETSEFAASYRRQGLDRSSRVLPLYSRLLRFEDEFSDDIRFQKAKAQLESLRR